MVMDEGPVDAAISVPTSVNAPVLWLMLKDGFMPYRLGVQAMDSLPRPNDDSGAMFSVLKRALDPNDILAPGRYDFRGDWPSRQDSAWRDR